MPDLPMPRNLGAELVDRGDGWHVSPEALVEQLADVRAELAKTVSNFEEFAEAAAEQRKRLTAERDEARAALERERTENAQWSLEAGRQTGEFIRDAQEQIAALTGERDQARRDAASWEDWGRGWKGQAEANQVERDKAWAEVDRLRAGQAAGRDGPRTWALPDGAEVEEQWTMRYLLNGRWQTAEEGGHVFDSREQATQHLEAWRSHFPTLTYTNVEYLRRAVITMPWGVVTDATPAADEARCEP